MFLWNKSHKRKMVPPEGEGQLQPDNGGWASQLTAVRRGCIDFQGGFVRLGPRLEVGTLLCYGAGR